MSSHYRSPLSKHTSNSQAKDRGGCLLGEVIHMYNVYTSQPWDHEIWRSGCYMEHYGTGNSRTIPLLATGGTLGGSSGLEVCTVDSPCV